MSLYRWFLLLWWCLACSVSTATAFGAPPRSANPSPVENSVVKVFATMRYPDLARSWTKQAPTEISASGALAVWQAK